MREDGGLSPDRGEGKRDTARRPCGQKRGGTKAGPLGPWGGGAPQQMQSGLRFGGHAELSGTEGMWQTR